MRNLFEGENFFGCVEPNGFHRHTEDDAGGFILCDGSAAGIADGEKSASAIVSHAGQKGGHGIDASVFGDGFEEDIDAGFLVTDRGAIGDVDEQLSAGSAKHHVGSTRGEQHGPGERAIVIDGLADLDLAERGKAIRKGLGEFGGHVLDNEGCGGVGGELRENGGKCLNTAGGGADGDEFIGGINAAEWKGGGWGGLLDLLYASAGGEFDS